MVFSSAIFLLLFLPATFITNYLIRPQYSNALLLIASLIFYAWGEPVMVFLMIFSIAFNWFVGVTIDGFAAGDKRKKWLFAVGIVVDLSFLIHYKYAGFLVSTLNSACGREVIPVPQITLPIGISFFTFQAISYIIDVYRGDTKASKNIINVALYIAFFPQLIAGPIVKYRDINKQIENRQITWDNVALGFRRFIYGLAKKILIANILGLCADTVYSFSLEELDPRTAWIGALAYTLQIYYDFSGYSDMAIGLGKMFGFSIQENFNYPYISASIAEFWRRWHISLGSWFREYVYIPLGGNRKGERRTFVNLIIVFFLTGLWHGADISFILWGLYHGTFQLVERLGLKKYLDRHRVFGRIYCFFVVNAGWVLFRSSHTMEAVRYLVRMMMPWRYRITTIPLWKFADKRTWFIGICAVFGMGILQKCVPKKLKELWTESALEAVWCAFLLVLCLASTASNTYSPFIYFQF